MKFVSDKISLLNQTVLESFKLTREKDIMKRFTEAGILALKADFGFAWLKLEGERDFHLAYKSPSTPYNPPPPRKGGLNYKVNASERPIFTVKTKKEKDPRYDQSPYAKSYVIIPVSYQKKNYGNIVLCFRKTNAFSIEDRGLCAYLGNSAAQAITISRLHGDLREFKYTLDKTLDSIFIFSPSAFQIVYVNQGASRLTGYSESELLKMRMDQIPYVSTFEDFEKMIEPLLTGRRSSLIYETEINTQSGQTLPVEIFIQYIPGTEGEGRFFGIARDISERKQAQETLEIAYKNLEDRIKERTFQLEQQKLRAESEKARSDAVLESMGEGIIVTDQEGKIVKLNPAAEELLGFSAQELQGKILHETLTLEDKFEKPVSHEKRPVQLAMNSRKRVTGQYYYYRKDHSKIPVGITVTPVISGNYMSGAVELFRDITQEMQIDKAKTEFVSLASHQLRTPMSAINWYTEAVLKQEIGKLNAKQKKYLQEVRTSNQRMIALVNALLNASRIELGTFSIDPEPLNIAEVGESIVDEIKPSIKEKHLQLKQKYSFTGLVLMDYKLLRIILQNLLTNAIKYTPHKGKVALVCQPAKHEGRTGVVIKVSDTGFGIPKHQEKNIFSKLFRADNVKARDTDGTGLGLYIVKSVVEYLKGTISFKTAENKGTTFTVFLPVTVMSKKDSVAS